MASQRRKGRRIKAFRRHKIYHPLPKKKRKQYTQEQMQRAIEMTSSGWISVCEAVERNGIPSTTLHDRVSASVVESLTMLTQDRQDT